MKLWVLRALRMIRLNIFIYFRILDLSPFIIYFWLHYIYSDIRGYSFWCTQFLFTALYGISCKYHAWRSLSQKFHCHFFANVFASQGRAFSPPNGYCEATYSFTASFSAILIKNYLPFSLGYHKSQVWFQYAFHANVKLVNDLPMDNARH